MNPLIYTLGTDRRTEEEFIEILLSYNIQCLIDVRRFPKSKISHFMRENLEPLLIKEGIRYFWLGKELGGFRHGGYSAYCQTEEFKNGISLLEKIVKDSTSVIVCAERFPWKCHRKWIARGLSQRGFHIEHIIDKGRVWQPKT